VVEAQAMSTTNQMIAVDLTASDDEDEKPRAREQAVLVDLTCDSASTTLTQQQQNSTCYATASLCRRKRNRNQSSTSTAIAAASATLKKADVFDLDDATAIADDADTRYKHALGPIRMEFCTDFSPPHSYAGTKPNPNVKTTKIFQELLEYKLNLPVMASSSIFVRAQDSRMDLVRVAITGPTDTPYETGIFMFDVHLQDYPAQAPHVKFLTTGGGCVRFNPNLYECGNVCLSLLGTWQGPGWMANQSTLLQVLISIQGLVLVPDPYFNEPGHNPQQPQAAAQSEAYNKNVRAYTMQYAVRDMLRAAVLSVDTSSSSVAAALKNKENKPPPFLYPEFNEVMKHHFAARADVLRDQLLNWTGISSLLIADIRGLLLELEANRRWH
jgi:ubiquitin-protein ligase